jgi:hypothetical protein
MALIAWLRRQAQLAKTKRRRIRVVYKLDGVEVGAATMLLRELPSKFAAFAYDHGYVVREDEPSRADAKRELDRPGVTGTRFVLPVTHEGRDKIYVVEYTAL